MSIQPKNPGKNKSPLERKSKQPGKNHSKWDIAVSLALAERVIQWLHDNPKEMYTGEFFMTKEARAEGLRSNLPFRLGAKYPEFKDAWEETEKITKARLVKGGLDNESGVNPRFAMFILERHHKGEFSPPAQAMNHSGEVTQKHTGNLTINFVVKEKAK